MDRIDKHCEKHSKARNPIDFSKPYDGCPVCDSGSEQDYRRGYYQGYSQAMDDWKALSRRGYIRSAEIWNILCAFFDGALERWRYGSTQELVEPPDAKYPDTWSVIRARVFERDGKRCTVCDSTHRLEVDHIVPVAEGGLPNDDNLRTLCARCHAGRRAR